jgi:putative acetyltransferase
MDIRVDDITGAGIRALLAEHLHHMYAVSPAESVHALDVRSLRQPDVTFWTAWSGTQLVGCGALKALGASHGEIKSMRTVSAYRRKGVARAMLQHIIDEARNRAYVRLSLETGSMQAFEPARHLYERFGFTCCSPFAGYTEDPNSVFLTLPLDGPRVPWKAADGPANAGIDLIRQ